MVPLFKEQTTQAGTTIERLTFSNTPFIEIYKDSNHSYSSLKYTEDTSTDFKNWINKLPEVDATQEDTGGNTQHMLSHFGHMETMRAGDRKTFTLHGETSLWYDTLPNRGQYTYLPAVGGKFLPGKPSYGMNQAYLVPKPSQSNVVFLRMMSVEDDTTVIKLGAQFQMDMFMDVEIRLPQDGRTYTGRRLDPQAQFCHTLQQTTIKDGALDINHVY